MLGTDFYKNDEGVYIEDAIEITKEQFDNARDNIIKLIKPE